MLEWVCPLSHHYDLFSPTFLTTREITKFQVTYYQPENREASKGDRILDDEAPAGSRKPKPSGESKVQIELGAQSTGQKSGDRNLNLKYY